MAPPRGPLGPIGPVGLGAPRDPAASARVRAYVHQVLAERETSGAPQAEGGADAVTVLVTELACSEPGCPPTETVIALLHPGAPLKHTIHKPLATVGLADVRAALAGAHRHGADGGADDGTP